MAIMDKNKIIKKVEDGEPLTTWEQVFYWVNVMGYTEEQAANMLAIVQNKDPDLIID